MPDHDNRLNGLTITRSQSLIDAIKNSGEIVSSKVDTVQNIESLLLLYEGYFFAVVIENEIIKISSSRIEIANDITPSRFIPYVDECSYDYILGYDINEVVTGTLIRWDENKHFNNFDDLAGAYEKISVAYEVVINYEFKTISLNGYAKGSINRLYPTRILCDDEGMRFLIE
jgi:hypothetical protein